MLYSEIYQGIMGVVDAKFEQQEQRIKVLEAQVAALARFVDCALAGVTPGDKYFYQDVEKTLQAIAEGKAK